MQTQPIVLSFDCSVCVCASVRARVCVAGDYVAKFRRMKLHRKSVTIRLEKHLPIKFQTCLLYLTFPLRQKCWPSHQNQNCRATERTKSWLATCDATCDAISMSQQIARFQMIKTDEERSLRSVSFAMHAYALQSTSQSNTFRTWRDCRPIDEKCSWNESDLVTHIRTLIS